MTAPPPRTPAGRVSAAPPSGAAVVALGARLARHRGVLYVAGGLLWVAWWGAPVALGLLLRALFDAIAEGSPGALGLGVVGLALVVLVVEVGRAGTVFGVVDLWLRWWVAARTLVRANLLAAQLARGSARAGAPVADPGGAVTTFRDDVDDLALYVDTWLDVAGAGVFAVVALAVMWQVDPLVTVVVVLPLALVVVVNRVLALRIRAWRRADREATQRVTGFLGELFAGVQAVQVAGAEDAAVRRLARVNADRRRTALRDRLLTDLLHGVSASVVDVAVGLVLLLAAASMRAGTFTVGDLALFTTYVAWLAALPRWTGILLARHRHAQVSAARLAALLPGGDAAAAVAPRITRLERWQPRPPRPRPPTSGPATIVVRGLAVRQPDGTPTLRAVDLDLPAGSLTVVQGPVGAGKTTLLRALLGLTPADAGTVWWNGVPVADLAAHMVPPHAAYVAQAPRLFGEPLRGNLTLGVDVPDAALDAALRLAVLDRDVAAMPDGLDTVVGSRGVRLSGGQAQRAAAARALVVRPALLVIDDLSSALDVATEQRLWEGLRAVPDLTILAVSHRRAALERADQVVTVEAGAVTAAPAGPQGSSASPAGRIALP